MTSQHMNHSATYPAQSWASSHKLQQSEGRVSWYRMAPADLFDRLRGNLSSDGQSDVWIRCTKKKTQRAVCFESISRWFQCEIQQVGEEHYQQEWLMFPSSEPKHGAIVTIDPGSISVSDVHYDFWNRLSATLSFCHSTAECFADACGGLRSEAVSATDYHVLWHSLIQLGQVKQIKAMKFITAYPMALWLRNELPKFPCWDLDEVVATFYGADGNPSNCSAWDLTVPNVFLMGSMIVLGYDQIKAGLNNSSMSPSRLAAALDYLDQLQVAGHFDKTLRQYFAAFPWLTGSTKRIVRGASIMRTTSNYAAKIFWGLLQGVKRGCNEAPEAFIAEAMLDHKAALTQKLPTIPADKMDQFRAKFAALFAGTCSKTREWTVEDKETGEKKTYRLKHQQNTWNKHCDQELVREVRTPGGGACVENPRSGGGRLGFLQRYARGPKATSTKSYLQQWWPDPMKAKRASKDAAAMVTEWFETLSPANGDLLLRMVETRPGCVNEVRGMPQATWSEVIADAFKSIAGTALRLPGYLVNKLLTAKEVAQHEASFIENEGRELDIHGQLIDLPNPGGDYSKALLLADEASRLRSLEDTSDHPLPIPIPGQLRRDRPLTAKVSPILEPLKCRLITKGEGICYQAAMPLQHALWKHLSKMPCFELIGCPLDGSHLAGLLQREDRLGHTDSKEQLWVSGDYSAATDGLSQQINSCCIEEAMRCVGATDLEKRVWSRVLGNHWINYPSDMVMCYEGLGPFEQTNGQLMGSPLSFPVLCSINLAAFWLAYEEFYNTTVEDPRSLPVLVNGDDILFRASTDFYKVWQKWISLAGFTLSVGKNYINRDVLTVNSECFLHVNQGNSAESFRKVGFLNPGLLFPYKCGKRPENHETPWIEKVNRVVNECSDPSYCHKRVLHYWKEEIAWQTDNGRYSLVGDQRFGCCGLSTRGWQGYHTRFQQLLAHFAISTTEQLSGTVCDLLKMSTMYCAKFCIKAKGYYEPMWNRSVGRLAKIVFRAKDEPLREHEERITSTDLTSQSAQTTWFNRWTEGLSYKIQDWSISLRKKFSQYRRLNRKSFDYENFCADLSEFHLEPRIHRSQTNSGPAGPTDEVHRDLMFRCNEDRNATDVSPVNEDPASNDSDDESICDAFPHIKSEDRILLPSQDRELLLQLLSNLGDDDFESSSDGESISAQA